MLAIIPLFLLIIAGLSWVLERAGAGTIDAAVLVERFFPPHSTAPGLDPFETVERFLTGLTATARRLSLVAVPAFLWFSTRLFSGVRTALNEIYDVHLRPVRRHFLLSYVFGKFRDFVMVATTLVLFLLNAGLSASLVLMESRWREAVPGSEFLITSVGRAAAELLAFLFLTTLFFVIYHGAAVRRPPWRATLAASVVAAVLFEIAKRLFGLYLRNVASYREVVAEVNVGALVLFVVWMYYSALVLLLGGVIAETWELRDLQRRQRMV